MFIEQRTMKQVILQKKSFIRQFQGNERPKYN